MDTKERDIGFLAEDEVNPFSKGTSERETIRKQFCGQIDLLDGLKYSCKNHHNTNNPLRLNAPIGIPNIGKSCYLSAALQSLMNMNIFIQKIVDTPFVIRTEAKFWHLFSQFAQAYRSKNMDDIIKFTKLLKIELVNENSDFKGLRQCDVTECIETILDILDHEVQLLCNTSSSLEANFVREMFTFKVGKEKMCNNCKEIDFFKEPQKIFRLSIEHCTQESLSFLKCVQDNFLMKNSNCRKCLKNCNIANWEYLPPILIFQLNRVMSKGKILKRVSLPSQFKIGFITYKLSSFSSHIGTPNFGHWLTDVRRNDSSWYTCDFKKVDNTSEDIIKDRSNIVASMIFQKL